MVAAPAKLKAVVARSKMIDFILNRAIDSIDVGIARWFAGVDIMFKLRKGVMVMTTFPLECECSWPAL
jgi:hypothetical protein